MCLWPVGKLKEKNMKKIIFFFGIRTKESDPDPNPTLLVRSTDPGIRIRTKISRIPNTATG